MVPPLAMTSDHRVVTCQIRCDAVAMSWLTPVLFVVGVAALLVGAEGLVRGASRVALRTGLSPVVIGLTVVAFGTSAPELAVSLGDAVGGSGDLALGNVVGSNIANILLVLGLSALVGGGLSVALRIVRIDVPIMIVVSAAVLVMALDHRLGRVDGVILVAVLIAYLWWTVAGARRTSDDKTSSEALGDYADALTPERLRATPVWRDLMYVAGGLGLLVVGAQFLVSAASDIASELGVSELVIGLTVVAIGTSLPEVATSVVAAARGQRDMAVGNAIGSNLFNLLAVLGITSMVSPVRVGDGALGFDLPFMVAVAVACLPVFIDGFEVKRWQGGVFCTYYAAYLTWLALDAADYGLHGPFSAAMGWFVVSITVITLTVVGWRGYGEYRASHTT